MRNEPIQIRDTVLEPGRYVLRLLDSQSDRHVVQIFQSRANTNHRYCFGGARRAAGTQGSHAIYLPAPAPAAATPAPEPQASAELAPQQETPAQSQPVNPESAPQEPTTIAQNSTPQDSTPPAPVDTNPAPDQTRQLPKTGSPYPLIGLSGTLLLGLYGLLRLKRFV